MANTPKSSNGNGGDTPAQAAAGAQQGSAPLLNVLAQYVKDLSFENPNAPQSLAGGTKNPSIQININVNARGLAEHDFEVELILEAKAVEDDKTIFAVDLTYAGIFRIQNVPKESLQPIVLIECPRLLFPFARQIIATATREGGYPPLLVDPIDFAALYRQRAQDQAAAPAQG